MLKKFRFGAFENSRNENLSKVKIKMGFITLFYGLFKSD